MKKTPDPKPVIYQINDNDSALEEFVEELRTKTDKEQDIIFNYPTIYIHNWKNTDKYEVYIGESNNVIQRTKQHFREAKNINSWQYQLQKNKAGLFFIGHELFNKSLTLDIENRLMQYILSIDKVKRIHNKRGNPQNKYYPVNKLDSIFHNIWMQLRKKDPDLFPVVSEIKNSAIFKASPLHKMTPEQETAKEQIIQRIFEALSNNYAKQLIFIEGEAGTGKTVLTSSTYYDLVVKAEDFGFTDLKCYLMVNHNEQITVYEQITNKLGLTKNSGNVVCKPTTFINNHEKGDLVDVAFVDEAHLLLTQGKQSYRGKNQLQDIIERSRVTVIMFDENQILTTEQYWEAEILDEYKSMAKQCNNYIELKNQLRMTADQDTIEWIDAFTKYRKLKKIPSDSKGYEIRIFDQPADLEKEIKRKAISKETALSRLIASYDWEYSSKKSVITRLSKYWEVFIDEWHKPWNYELKQDLSEQDKKKIESLSWAEQPQTINEVGSTFTIQGFDLNYAGVILGPSVKYRNGEIIFDATASRNNKAIQNRTLSDGTKQKFGETLIQHEIRVLLTRGVHGLYIYACDDELRNALKQAALK